MVHGSETVTVSVGLENKKRTFIIHKGLLTSHSEFFKTALKVEWVEGQKRIVSLPVDDPEAFDIFYNFLYTGQIFSCKDGDFKEVKEAKDNLNVSHIDSEWARLPNCWILGQKLLSTSFQDATTDAIIAKVVGDRMPAVDLHEIIYPKSSPTSAVRKVLVDMAVWNWPTGTMSRRRWNGEWAQFFFDVAVAKDRFVTDKDQGRGPLYAEDTCGYHEHKAEGKPCYKTMF